MNKAVFLDRDGTIIKDRGCITHKKDVEFYNSTFESLRKLQKHFLLFVISNQPGIAKGSATKQEVESVNSYIVEQLQKQGIIIQEFYYCPHHKEDRCICRKPNPYFIKQSIKRYSINTHDSFVIGDHPSDIQLAFNAHAKGIYLLTGHGRKHLQDLRTISRDKIAVCKNLNYATRLILNLSGNRSE